MSKKKASDYFSDPKVQAWADDVIHGMVPKLRDSAMTCAIMPTSGEGDVKQWVELGASIMMNKPIILLVTSPRDIPPKLRAIADEIIVGPINEETAKQLHAAMERIEAGL